MPARRTRLRYPSPPGTISVFARFGSETGLFVPSVANLKAARPLARNDDLAVPQAQFDLSNVSASAVNFLGDESRSLLASELFTPRIVSAPMNANGRRRGIEIWLKHDRENQTARYGT